MRSIELPGYVILSSTAGTTDVCQAATKALFGYGGRITKSQYC